jgi:hypothetical protein
MTPFPPRSEPCRRLGNPSPPPPGSVMQLIARAGRGVGPPATNPARPNNSAERVSETLELASCEVDPASGTFRLPATPLSPAGLTPGSDYEIWLQLRDGMGRAGAARGEDGGGAGEDEAMAEGSGGGGGGEPAVSLLVRTLYVSLMGDSATLRGKVQRLQAEVRGGEGENPGGCER